MLLNTLTSPTDIVLIFLSSYRGYTATSSILCCISKCFLPFKYTNWWTMFKVFFLFISHTFISPCHPESRTIRYKKKMDGWMFFPLMLDLLVAQKYYSVYFHGRKFRLAVTPKESTQSNLTFLPPDATVKNTTRKNCCPETFLRLSTFKSTIT